MGGTLKNARDSQPVGRTPRRYQLAFPQDSHRASSEPRSRLGQRPDQRRWALDPFARRNSTESGTMYFSQRLGDQRLKRVGHAGLLRTERFFENNYLRTTADL